MADWSTPVLTSTYTSVLDGLKNRDIDMAVGFSPTYSTPTNLPTGAIRWNPTNGYWEILAAGGSWGPLIAKYLIDSDKLDGQHGTYFLDWANFTSVPATFPPSVHTHDDRYFTEAEGDARYGNNLFVSGNTIVLRTPGNVTLNSITVPYATAAGNSTTVGGFSVGQNLLTTSSPTFTGITVENATVQGTIFLGNAGDLNPTITFWDDANVTQRSLLWSSAAQDWYVEDATGVTRRLYHTGVPPTWTEVSGKPTTFAPTAHGHIFTTALKAQLYSAATATLAAYAGGAGEIAFDTTTKRLRTYDGTLTGGYELARVSDIPAAPDLSPYATLAGTNTFTSTQTAPVLRLTATTALSLTSTGHAFQIGLSTTVNLAQDTSSIQARNNGAVSPLFINNNGGDVTIGGATSIINITGTLAGAISFTGSMVSTADNDGTFSTGTYAPTPVGGNFKRIVNAGAFTLAAPTVAGDYTMVIQISNTTGAGAITLSGFTSTDGYPFTLTSTHKFLVYVTKVNGLTHANVVALQ